MSNLSLFLLGTLVTLIVAASMTLLIVGAILDGRTARELEEAEHGWERLREEQRLDVVDAA